MDIEHLLSNTKGFCTEKYIKLHYKEDYDKIVLCEGSSFSEKLYNYWYNDGKGKRCIVCSQNLARFNSITTGYSNYCSRECVNNSSFRSEKVRTTCRKKYGVDNPSQSQLIKDKKSATLREHYGVDYPLQSSTVRDKTKLTCRKKYGVDNPSQSQIVKDKKLVTSREHYGVDSPFQSSIVKDKAKSTCLERYGVDNILKLENVRTKAKERYYDKCFKNRDNDIIDIKSSDRVYYTCLCPHTECHQCNERLFDIGSTIYRDRKRAGIELCTKLLPEQSLYSTFELYIRSILDKLNIEYLTNIRNIISPKELDIYIPSYHLAIECNGVYWHNSIRHEARYHYEKYKACTERGIQLLTFWEDQYNRYPQKIESMLLSKLGVYEHKIGARECTIREIDHSTSKEFIDTYHLQNSTNSKVRLGLYYHDELISVMTFSHRKGGQGRGDSSPWILDRYCVKRGYLVLGGAHKLLNYFIKQYSPKTITSFASNDISDGSIYKKLGFKEISTTIPYWYIDSSFIRYHRSSFTKSAIVKRGWKDSIDSSWTEAEVTQEHNLNKIYDSGVTKYILTIDK